MEACGSAHFWARRISALGHTVRLLPAHYVKAYVRRNKTDQADAGALIEAARCAEIREVPVKTVEAQQIQSLHRLRSQWMSTRQRCVNTLRGILREFGFAIPLGVNVAKAQIGLALSDTETEIPAALRETLAEMFQEIAVLEEKILTLEHRLSALTRTDLRVQQLRHECERQRGHNKATVALANRVARIVWATWKFERPFDGNWSTEAN
jgi:transposase